MVRFPKIFPSTGEDSGRRILLVKLLTIVYIAFIAWTVIGSAIYLWGPYQTLVDKNSLEGTTIHDFSTQWRYVAIDIGSGGFFSDPTLDYELRDADSDEVILWGTYQERDESGWMSQAERRVDVTLDSSGNYVLEIRPHQGDEDQEYSVEVWEMKYPHLFYSGFMEVQLTLLVFLGLPIMLLMYWNRKKPLYSKVLWLMIIAYIIGFAPIVLRW